MSRGCMTLMAVFWVAFILGTLVADQFMETARAAEVGTGVALAALLLYLVISSLRSSALKANPTSRDSSLEAPPTVSTSSPIELSSSEAEGTGLQGTNET